MPPIKRCNKDRKNRCTQIEKWVQIHGIEEKASLEEVPKKTGNEFYFII